jgi:hypothetical protein
MQFPISAESSPNVFASSRTKATNINDLTQYPINDDDDSIIELSSDVKQLSNGSGSKQAFVISQNSESATAAATASSSSNQLPSK